MQIEETYTSYDFSRSSIRTRQGLTRRLMARLIDYQMILIFFLFTDFLTDGLIMENMHWFMKQVTGVPTQPLTVMYLSLLFAGYFILFHSLGGQTPGKFICAVRVIRRMRPNRIQDRKSKPCENISVNWAGCLGLFWADGPSYWFFESKPTWLHDWLGSSIVRGA